MNIFPVIIGKLRRDVTDDKEVLRDWDFAFIHRTVYSDSGCLEAKVIMVYCTSFGSNTNISNREHVVGLISLWRKRQADEAHLVLLENLFQLRSGPKKIAALGYPGAKISLKEDAVLTLFLIVEAVLMPSICRTYNIKLCVHNEETLYVVLWCYSL